MVAFKDRPADIPLPLAGSIAITMYGRAPVQPEASSQSEESAVQRAGPGKK